MTLPFQTPLDIRSDDLKPTQGSSSNFLRQEIIKGLSKTDQEKTIPFLLHYDQTGLQLFEAITYLEDYYLTRTESDLIKKNVKEIVDHIETGSWLVELGGGALRKTAIILDELEAQKKEINYYSLDVDRSELIRTLQNLDGRYQHIKLHGLWGTYDDCFNWLVNQRNSCPSFNLLWLGSSIGNMIPEESAAFLRKVGSIMRQEDGMFVAIDGKHDTKVVKRAYNDEQGIVRKFNLNTITHINKLFESSVLDVTSFDYDPVYNEIEDRHEGYLICKEDVSITFPGHEHNIHLSEGEKIFLNYSHKYPAPKRNKLYRAGGAQPKREWIVGDDEYTFALLVWVPPNVPCQFA